MCQYITLYVIVPMFVPQSECICIVCLCASLNLNVISVSSICGLIYCAEHIDINRLKKKSAMAQISLLNTVLLKLQTFFVRFTQPILNDRNKCFKTGGDGIVLHPECTLSLWYFLRFVLYMCPVYTQRCQCRLTRFLSLVHSIGTLSQYRTHTHTHTHTHT